MIKSFQITFILSFFLIALITDLSYSQSISPDSIEYRYWIYFKDKGDFKPDDKIESGSPAYNLAISQLSEKAIQRRSKVLSEGNIVSFQDLPVYQEYIDEITSLGVNIYAVSKWFNAVSIKVTDKVLKKIESMSFVQKIEGVHYLKEVKYTSKKHYNYLNYNIIDTVHLKYNYGLSYWQNEQINVPILHYCGITGWGVTVGMCDAGFNWRNHQALSKKKVLGEYDWIFKDDSTLNQFAPNQFPDDSWDQDSHGTSTLSTLGGFYEGKLIGPAFNSEFYLSKTEYVPTETPVEEDYWLEGVEWMEAQGIEVLSSSLIYKPFNKPNNGYDYNDMDGKTTVVVRAAEHLAYLGVVVCNSMGNERQTTSPSVVSPPDGDSVIAVGAVDSAGIIADFSSNGPTIDNRIKPDVVAMGVDDWVAESMSFYDSDSAYSYASGTSFSCPITAGVCALILSAHPELTPMQVKEALKMTANNKDTPNNVYGWGLINAYDAVLYYGMVMSNIPEILVDSNQVTVSTFVLSKNYIFDDKVKIYYSLNGIDFTPVLMRLIEKLDDNNSGKYTATFKIDFDILKLYFSATDEKQMIYSPYGAPDKFFLFKKDDMQIQLYK